MEAILKLHRHMSISRSPSLELLLSHHGRFEALLKSPQEPGPPRTPRAGQEAPWGQSRQQGVGLTVQVVMNILDSQL